MVFIVLLIFVILFIFIAKFGISYAGKLTEKMMTDRFQDANTILNEKAVPKRWVDSIEKKVFHPNFVQVLRERLQDTTPDRQVLAKQELMLRLEKLAKYFEKCPFFEDPESKKIMQEELEGIQKEWEPKAWAELIRSPAGA